MSIFVERLLPLLFLAVLQQSFFDILFPSLAVPVLVVALAVALAVIVGFERALGWSLLALFLSEMLGAGRIDTMAPLLVVLVYGASFLSRRLVFEHRFRGVALLSLLAATGTIPVAVFSMLVSGHALSVLGLLITLSAVLILFPPIFLAAQWWERRIVFGQMAEFRGLQT
jgi:hypothetical protein